MVRGVNPGGSAKGARIYPRKRLGQNFLTDRSVIAKIVEAAAIVPGERLLEIGPGTGNLTAALLGAGARVTAVEIDPRLCSHLEEEFNGADGFRLVRGDALKLSFADLFAAGSGGPSGRFKVVANLPYNISAPILFKFLEERDSFTTLTLMLQKEVAARICSPPGSKVYGILSVLLGVWYEITKEFDVSRGSFSPPPKVDSTVITLKRLDAPSVEVADDASFISVVKAAFGTRRKMLQNSLKSLGVEKGALMAAFAAAGIDPTRRAEELTRAEFSSLTTALYGKSS